MRASATEPGLDGLNSKASCHWPLAWVCIVRAGYITATTIGIKMLKDYAITRKPAI